MKIYVVLGCANKKHWVVGVFGSKEKAEEKIKELYDVLMQAKHEAKKPWLKYHISYSPDWFNEVFPWEWAQARKDALEAIKRDWTKLLQKMRQIDPNYEHYAQYAVLEIEWGGEPLK